MKTTRRQAIVLTASTALVGMTGLPAFAADGDQYKLEDLMKPAGTDKGVTDHMLGEDDATVTVIEYASPTCPHCAVFATQTFPALKEKYVDTGKIKFIMRPFLRNVLDAVVFMLADTADTTEGWYQIVDTYFGSQNDWAFSDKPKDEIMKIALQLGFDEKSFEAALENQTLFDGMNELRQQAIDDFGLTGTPTFYFNGKAKSGELSVDIFSEEVDPLL